MKYNYIKNLTTTTATTTFLVIPMSTYNNGLGNFLPPSNDLSDLDNDDYEDSASEPEPEMGIRSSSLQAPVIDQRTQIVQTLSSKSNKKKCIYNSDCSFFCLSFFLKINIHFGIRYFLISHQINFHHD